MRTVESMRDMQSIPILIAWPVVYFGLVKSAPQDIQPIEKSKMGEEDSRILGQISERSDESRHICNHNLHSRCRSPHIMRRNVVRQPSHHEWGTWEDTRSNEESAAILYGSFGTGDEHDISTDSEETPGNHERPTHTKSIGQMADEEDTKECEDVWWDGKELGFDACIA